MVKGIIKLLIEVLMTKKAPKKGPNFGRDIDDIRYTVSSSLRAFIETERRSQKWLAENTGLTCAAINQYLKGSRVPSLDVVGVLMSVTNLSFEQLTGIAEIGGVRHGKEIN